MILRFKLGPDIDAEVRASGTELIIYETNLGRAITDLQLLVDKLRDVHERLHPLQGTVQ